MAAQLTNIKSRLLLPQPNQPETESEDDAAELSEQLLLLKRYRNAAQRLARNSRRQLHPRLNRSHSLATGFSNLSLDELQKTMAELISEQAQQTMLNRTIMRRRRSIAAIRQAFFVHIESATSIELGEVAQLAQDGLELMVYFLCLLELVKSSRLVAKAQGGTVVLERSQHGQA